ncbi:AAA family ATPase [uncultured Sulfitobacter sp.]|uniref:AAA family ATPase n=1 Tax=uncultured Sulfitobacter sp. TaxID=191468 RepID=UPI0026204CCA|nr:AAA family ATPase [uncultured Sulfitobacter sp.]
MKLRSLTLSNVRKFAGQTATLSGIGDGVSVVSEANEFGKSTFFDALYALFFLKYGAATREVKSLQPQTGGPVRIAAEVELPAGRFTLEKSFLAQKRASVRDAGGTLVAQDDEAERWIAALMDKGLEGPAGLLWVRQGVTALEPSGSTGAEKTEKEKLLGARRDLLSSVAGEIDMVTGGRRMDRVIEAARAALAQLATATGQPKTNGPWKDAVQEAEALQTRKAELEAACSTLTASLAKRRQVAGMLVTLDQPEARKARQTALDEAERADRAAAAHADRLSEMRAQQRLAQLEYDRSHEALERLLKQADAYTQAGETLEKTRAHLESCRTKADTVAQRVRVAEAELRAATLAVTTHRRAREAAQQGALRRNAQEKHDALAKRLKDALAKRAELEQTDATLAALRMDLATLDRIEAAHERYRKLQAEAVSGGVRMQLSYEGSTRVLRNGQPLEAETHTILAPDMFDLPGIGRMTLDPGSAAADIDKVDGALTELNGLLEKAGVADLSSARAATRRRQEVQGEVKVLKSVLHTLAPDGIGAIQTALAEAAAVIQAHVPTEQSGADPETLIRDLEASEAREAQARATYDAAVAEAAGAQTALARAQAQQAAATATFETSKDAHGDPQTYPARKAGAAQTETVAEAALAQATDAVEVLGKDAPDRATVTAGLARARSAVDNAQRDIARLTAEQADLNATIRARAEDGVEEALAEVTGRYAIAQDRADRFAHEAESLALLVETLTAKRGAAQETYFGPVQHELAPLLAILHADAALSFDPASLLPDGLARDGTQEKLEVLSGGTQEQIAILTRLAFARLFAKQGKPMPIVLDDALVYSDDDRIIKMFTALHRVALDQQVIVFSCRQMAFSGLGGTRPTVEITPMS